MYIVDIFKSRSRIANDLKFENYSIQNKESISGKCAFLALELVPKCSFQNYFVCWSGITNGIKKWWRIITQFILEQIPCIKTSFLAITVKRGNCLWVNMNYFFVNIHGCFLSKGYCLFFFTWMGSWKPLCVPWWSLHKVFICCRYRYIVFAYCSSKIW